MDAVFYHIYPLGLCGAPERNDFSAAPTPRIAKLYDWLDHIINSGFNAVYLGPIFESTAHGYDTADYYTVDRRLGDQQTMQALLHTMKARGLRVVLDGVFNHVGRDFWAFKDVQANGANSAYAGWFQGLDFTRQSPYGDGFRYEGWAGHYDLVKLNLHHPGVQEHLFGAVDHWIDTFDIDGLRLDAADVVDKDFLRALSAHCKTRKADFWLMGEVVHGDYNQWNMLDSVTNYECYKGLYSSHVDCNYFEIAYSLNRQFGEGGIYRDMRLYNFADNHDVNRVASSLTNPAHLYPLYILLMTIPGIPSVYYGSEWGIIGKRDNHSDKALRPVLDVQPPNPLSEAITRMIQVRKTLPALSTGNYQQLHVNHEQFAFQRSTAGQTVIVAVNAADQPVNVQLNHLPEGTLHDQLNPGDHFTVKNGSVTLPLYTTWGRILTF